MTGSVSAAQEAVAALLGVPTTGAHPLSSTVAEIELADGDLVVAKRGTGAGATTAEAAGLAWLAEPAAVPLPAVRGHDGCWLVMQRVEPGEPSAAAAEELGRGLARLHAAGAPAFGSPPPGGPVDAWIGMAPMRNVTGERWPEWYAAHRVLPYLRRAVDRGTLAGSGARAIEQACDRIDTFGVPAEPPARLHGDLWQGNVHFGRDGRAWLLDPAAHGGHRETDLAMLQLFGCPELQRVLAAYHEAAPLAEGWRQRVPLHQLFPLLVHAVLFGGGYAAQAVAAARQALMLR